MKEEIKTTIIRESIILAFSMVGVLIAYKLAGDDSLKPIYMRALRGFKRVSQNQADAWQKAADAAATMYNQAKL